MVPQEGGFCLSDPRDTGPVAAGFHPPEGGQSPALPFGLDAPPSRRRRILVLALLAAVTFAVFAGALGADWLQFDDPMYVRDNEHVNRGVTLDGIVYFLHQPHSANWHPLTSLSHMIDVELFGLNPAGHHAVNIVLHVLNALLLVIGLHRLTGAWWRSVLVGALFALHPLRVESVAWISERKDVLSSLFFLLTLGAYARWAAAPAAGRYALLIALFALGLMAKPMLLTLPVLLLLLDAWPLGRAALPGGGRPAGGGAPCALPPSRLIAEKWPLFALAAASVAVTIIFQRLGGAVVPVTSISIERRTCNAAISCWRYIGQMFRPAGLAPYYPYSLDAQVAGAVVAVVALGITTVLVLRRLRTRPWLAIGWLWYLVMLVPVIGLLQVGGQAHADRYTYLPGIGIVVALVWWVGDLVGDSRRGRMLVAAASLIVLTVLSAVTVRQVARWKDTRTLFAYALTVDRDNPVAHQCLGTAYLQDGEVEKAISQLEEAVRLAPALPEAHNNLGTVLGILNRHEEAIRQFEIVLQQIPDSPDAHNNLGTSLAALGRYEEAIVHFRAALKKMNTADVHQNLAYALGKLGRTDESIREYEEALRLDPKHFQSLARLSVTLGTAGRLSEAEALMRRALRLKPENTEVRRMLAATLTQEGRVEDAIREYNEVLRGSPDDLDALNNVAWIRATHAEAAHRSGAEAVRLAEQARDKSPEPAAVLYSTLAAAYAEAGRFPEAVRAGRRAVELAAAAGEAEDAKRYAAQLDRYLLGRPFHFDK